MSCRAARETLVYRYVINKIRDFDLPLVGGRFSSTPRLLRERVEFQVELLRNLEIRLSGGSVGQVCQTDTPSLLLTFSIKALPN